MFRTQLCHWLDELKVPPDEPKITTALSFISHIYITYHIRFFSPRTPPPLSPPHPCYPSSSLGSQVYLSSSSSAFLQSCQKLFLSQSFISLECELQPSPVGCLLPSHSSLQASPQLPSWLLPTVCCYPLPSRKKVGNICRKKNGLLAGPRQGTEAVRRETGTGEDRICR